MAIVRRAEPRDAPSVIALVGALRQQEVATDPEPQRQVLLDYLAYDDVAVLVAESDDGNVAGVVSMWVRPRLNRAKPEAWIADLYVDPSQRRARIASSLVGACIREARRRGCHRVVLECAHHREDAHAFYEAIGFAHSARRYQLVLEEE